MKHRPDKAIPDFEKSARLDAKSAAAFFNACLAPETLRLRGIAHARAGHRVLSVADLEQALARAPTPWQHTTTVTALLRQQQPQRDGQGIRMPVAPKDGQRPRNRLSSFS